MRIHVRGSGDLEREKRLGIVQGLKRWTREREKEMRV